MATRMQAVTSSHPVIVIVLPRSVFRIIVDPADICVGRIPSCEPPISFHIAMVFKKCCPRGPLVANVDGKALGRQDSIPSGSVPVVLKRLQSSMFLSLSPDKSLEPPWSSVNTTHNGVRVARNPDGDGHERGRHSYCNLGFRSKVAPLPRAPTRSRLQCDSQRDLLLRGRDDVACVYLRQYQTCVNSTMR